MDDNSQQEHEQPFRAGFVALAGRPNVGKSTLVNALLGQKVAAASPRPQTTRRKQLGIWTAPHAQVIFVDTPGIHEPRHLLGACMNREATDALQDSDGILWIVDVSQAPHTEDQMIAAIINEQGRPIPKLMALNKVDLVEPDLLAARELQYGALMPEAAHLPIAASTGYNLDALMGRIIGVLPESPPYFPPDQVTDLYEREIAADLIREAALIALRDEIPHGIAIRIDEYKERGDRGAYIAATLFVERESQKPIVIGSGGRMLKRIGTHARQEIEAVTGRSVYLDLRVKVRKNWRNDRKALQKFGYRLN